MYSPYSYLPFFPAPFITHRSRAARAASCVLHGPRRCYTAGGSLSFACINNPTDHTARAHQRRTIAMGYVALGGYLLIGCGPALVLFGTRVAHRAFLVVLTFTRCVARVNVFFFPVFLVACPVDDVLTPSRLLPSRANSCATWIVCSLVLAVPSLCKTMHHCFFLVLSFIFYILSIPFVPSRSLLS